MLMNARNTHTCPYGRKCCDSDGRPKKAQRRTVRRREKMKFKREET